MFKLKSTILLTLGICFSVFDIKDYSLVSSSSHIYITRSGITTKLHKSIIDELETVHSSFFEFLNFLLL